MTDNLTVFIVDDDPSVRDAVMRRQLLLQAMPGAPASLAVAQLSNKIKAELTAPV